MSENVFNRDDPNLPILTLIAKSLGTLCDSLVFVGGCATGLLLTTPRAQAIRATQDVDVVVHAVSTADYHAMEKAVESRGFKHDLSPEAPICRWVLQGVALDLMPSQPGILGFHNRWYPLAIETATQIKLSGMDIRLITAPVFVATKFEAFHGRGNTTISPAMTLKTLLRWSMDALSCSRKLIKQMVSCGAISPPSSRPCSKTATF